MQRDDIKWPQKTREMHNHHIDSTIWNDFEFRDGDVIVASWPKSGTTWTQQLVGQIVTNGAPGLDIAHISPWLDLRVPPAPVKLGALAKAQGRRFLKTHLPVDALVYSKVAKYVYIGRDGRDVVWSLFHHPPHEGERHVVRHAQQHAGACRRADAAAAGDRPRVF